MWSLVDASPGRLSELAKELDASGRWTSFLTPHEHQFFEAALNAKEPTWALFLEGRVPCQLRIAGADDATPVAIDVDPVALAFRVRYMLWDMQLERLGDGDAKKDPHSAASRQVSGSEVAPPSNQRPQSTRNDDEDYDDEDEDENGDNSTGATNGTPDVPRVLVVDAKEEDSEPDPRGRVLTVQNFSKMYHTFETDNETMERYRQLQASDEQIETPGEGPNDASGTSRATSETSKLAALAKTAQFGSASLSLKHLLGTIESKWSELHVTDIELRNLISDVRKNRSKWASEERIGQEELYEACDKVVQELRNTTEHSTAFLNKVNKRDAPNYYQIIKNPMDLNTVSRKLRIFQYNSKQEFVDDLNLIWQNCLTYNSDPRHFLRAHAIAMRKKTATLSPLIPDIKVRDRAEVEAEAEEQERLRGLGHNQNKRKAVDGADGGKGQKRKLGKAPAATTTVNGEDEAADPETAVDDLALNDETSRNGTAAPSSARESSPSSGSGSAAPSQSASAHPSRPPSRTTSVPPQDDISPEHEGNNGVKDDDETGDGTSAPTKDDSAAGQPVTVDAADLPNPEASGNVGAQRSDLQEASEASGQRLLDAEPQDDVASVSASDKTSEEDRVAPPIEEDYYAPDAETAVWNTATKRRRLECISNRRALFVDDRLQMDAPIELRRPGLMARFDNAIRSEDNVGQNAGISLLSVDPGEEPFLVEYEVNAGLPAQPIEDQSAWLTAPLPHPDELPPTRYIASGKVSELVNKNLNEMQMIRRLCSKILFIRDLQNGQISQQGDPAAQTHPGAQGSQDYPDVHDPEADISSRLPGAMPLDSKASYAAMHRATAKIAMHAGFEAAQPAAVDVLAEIAGDYLFKLGHTLVAHLEAPGSSASFGSILRGTLSEMGLPKLDMLSRYISDDIVKQGKRLSTFRSRLNNTLVEILRPEVDRYNDEQFNDNSDQFVMGQFSNELGDDYFGFKELGLERELGVANIAIPFHLLRQRLVADQSAGIAGPGRNIDLLGLEVPEYPPLTPESAAALPRFLREGLTKVLPKSAQAGVTAAVAKAENGEATPELTDIEKEERAKSHEVQSQAIAKVASQAAAARSKTPASGKLVARKKNIDKAFKRKKPVSVKAEEPPEEESANAAQTGLGTASQAAALDQHALTPSEDRLPESESGNMPFTIDDAPASHSFNLDDNLNAGSLMLDAGDAENEGDADAGDAEGAGNDGAEIDELDMGMPGLDF